MKTPYYSVMETPVGALTLRWAGDALTGLFFDKASTRAWCTEWTRDDACLAPVAAQLDEYFRGERKVFDLPIAFEGTPFQISVWEALRTIPYGTTASYGEIARRIGKPDWSAARAVGAANGQNPVAVIVPCHRVIGADGSLTGFGGGLPRKRWLLTHEGSAFREERTHLAGAQTTLPLS